MIPNQQLQFRPYKPHFKVGCGEYSGEGDQGLLIAEALNQRLDGVELVINTHQKKQGFTLIPQKGNLPMYF